MRRPETRYLATVIWVRNIQKRLGGIRLGAIEKWVLEYAEELSWPDDFWQDYSRRFKQYLKQLKTPSDEYIDLINKLLPKTKLIFQHPLWKILDAPNATQQEIDCWLTELEPNAYRRIFRSSKRSGKRDRRTIRGSEYISNISKENNLDALAALLLLMREAEINEDFVTCVDSKWEAQDLLCRLATFSPVREIAADLNDLIDERFIRKATPGIPPHQQKFIDQLLPKLDILREAELNGQSILHSLILGFLPFEDEEAQLHYLYKGHQFAKQSLIIDTASEPQSDLFPKELISEASRVVRDFRNNRAVGISEADQFGRNMHVDALAIFARRAGID